jgi:tetratricopeptide (TPR) repeat protein
MSKRTPTNPDHARPLPERPNLERLRKEAKQRLKATRLDNPGVTLSAVQLTVAREYGFSSWRSLFAYIKSLPDKGRLRPTDSDVSNAFNDGLEAAEKGNYQTAVAHFRHALRERPLRIRAHYYLGRALFRLQLYREALTAFEELLKFDPENLLAHYEIGKLRLYAQNSPPELLSKFDPENLLANYEIGNRYLSPQNYADAIAKYQWLRSQSENSIDDLDDSTYELLPDEPRGGNLVQNPFHRAYAAKLAQYLLDLIPPQVTDSICIEYDAHQMMAFGKAISLLDAVTGNG